MKIKINSLSVLQLKLKSPLALEGLVNVQMYYPKVLETFESTKPKDKSETLNSLYQILDVFYSGVNLPCIEINDIMKKIRSIYRMEDNNNYLKLQLTHTVFE